MQPGRPWCAGDAPGYGLHRRGVESSHRRVSRGCHGGQYIEPVWFSPLTNRLPLPSGSGLLSLCAACHGWGRQRLCAGCVARFGNPVPRCVRCALEVPTGAAECGACLRDPPPFERTVAAVDYAHPWNRLITSYKFHQALDLAPAFAGCMLEALQRSGASHPDILLPVPLSEQRLRERGYNQAWELTRRLGRALRHAADAQLLLRVKDSLHQVALPLAQRAAHVRGAFAVEPRRLRELQGREVALVDDVMTTGATAAEIARVLLQAGAARVHVWVLARTPRPEDR